MAITQSTILPLQAGEFKINYHKFSDGYCLSFIHGDILVNNPIVRIHSSCLFGESFHSLDCDCQEQLDMTLELIKKNESGVVIYTYAEGRGIGLENKIKSLEIERVKKIDTVEAFKTLGYESDLRNYANEIGALKELNINKNLKIVSGNPYKIDSLIKAGFNIIEKITLKVTVNQYNKSELLAKKNKLGYSIDL